MRRLCAPSLALSLASLSGCAAQHLTVPDLVVEVRYGHLVTSPGGREGRARSRLSGLIGLRMNGAAPAEPLPPGPRPRRRVAPLPCESPALCAWQARAARRATERLLGALR